MTNWFKIISISNILIFVIGFLIGRFWRLGKKIIKNISKESETNE